jgi:hypothetical protein
MRTIKHARGWAMTLFVLATMDVFTSNLDLDIADLTTIDGIPCIHHILFGMILRAHIRHLIDKLTNMVRKNIMDGARNDLTEVRHGWRRGTEG